MALVEALDPRRPDAEHAARLRRSSGWVGAVGVAAMVNGCISNYVLLGVSVVLLVTAFVLGFSIRRYERLQQEYEGLLSRFGTSGKTQ